MILQPTTQNIRLAVEALRRGELIGLPTETVYGIAAIATNRSAVLNTFALKGRPAANPLIVHIASLSQAEPLVSHIPAYAKVLADACWPGPITLVLPKSPVVPYEVTAGLQTVAVRVPGHPVAQMILQAVCEPLSAPSANTFMSLSPTRAEHISPEILSGLACVVDGGPSEIGVESTVVDCCEAVAAILRPGGISRAQIEALIGPVGEAEPKERRSPGLYKRHYSPRTPMSLVQNVGSEDAGVVFGEPLNRIQVQLPRSPSEYAANLYATLFELDQQGFTRIYVEMPPNSPEWATIWDRLHKMVG